MNGKKGIKEIFDKHEKSGFTDYDWLKRSVLEYMDDLVLFVIKVQEVKLEKLIAKKNLTQLKEMHKMCKFKSGL